MAESEESPWIPRDGFEDVQPNVTSHCMYLLYHFNEIGHSCVYVLIFILSVPTTTEVTDPKNHGQLCST